MASAFFQSSIDPYVLSSDDEEYLTHINVAEETPGIRDCGAHSLTTARHYFNSPPTAPKHWGQIIPNLNDYNSDLMEISVTFWIQDIADRCCQPQETHSMYVDLRNVKHDRLCIISNGVRVEVSFPFVLDVIGGRQSTTAGDTLCGKVALRQFTRANNRILAGANPELHTINTENDLEMKKEAERNELHRMVEVHYYLEKNHWILYNNAESFMWQGSQDLCATQKESRAQNHQMTAIWFISDTEKIVKATWSLSPRECVAAFKLSERSPSPPALSAMNLPGGRTQILNDRQIRRINCYSVEIDENSTPYSISGTEDLLNWNGHVDSSTDSEDDCAENIESETEWANGVEAPECPEARDVSMLPNVPWSILPIWKSMKHGAMVELTVNAVETRRNKAVKEK